MEFLCDFCGIVRADVYCKSDSARLCLQCDNIVHSANSLSRRHPRSFICDKCNVRPAIVRCMDDKMSLCQNCESYENGWSGAGHRLFKLSFYTGCPCLDEFSNMLSSLPEVPYQSVCDSSFSPVETLVINENSVTSCLDQSQNEGSSGLVASKLNDLSLSSSVKFEPFVSQPSIITPVTNYLPQCNRDQAPFFSEGSNLQKHLNMVKILQNCLNLKDIGLGEGDDLCEGVDLDDVALNFDTGYEMFGCSQGQSKYQYDDGVLDCLLEKNLSVTESNSRIENPLEASSGQQDRITFQSSQMNGSSTTMQTMSCSNGMLLNPSCNRSIGLAFPTGSLALSTITGESCVADYQDCGLSPVFLAGEAPWESSLETCTPQARDKAKMRYNEKKKTRTFGKQIRYASRKARADTRKRVKGRFVKAGEAYDYDPIDTRSF